MEPTNAMITHLYAEAEGRVVDGLPGIRDVDNPCELFEPGPAGELGPECLGDGHYICAECGHLAEWRAKEMTGCDTP